jgi:uncharacterized membrane protein YdjX (TVP38/TMEM64 family)
MVVVFVFRMIPFTSFDNVSYVERVTALSWWRFSFATAVGCIPVSFLLAHHGAEMVESEIQTLITVFLLGLTDPCPRAVCQMKRRTKRQNVTLSLPQGLTLENSA